MKGNVWWKPTFLPIVTVVMGVRRNFSRGGKVDILLMFRWLLTMQRKLTYTKKENVKR